MPKWINFYLLNFSSYNLLYHSGQLFFTIQILFIYCMQIKYFVLDYLYNIFSANIHESHYLSEYIKWITNFPWNFLFQKSQIFTLNISFCPLITFFKYHYLHHVSKSYLSQHQCCKNNSSSWLFKPENY